MNCDNCGACCLHMAVPPFMLEEIEALPVSVRDDFESAMAVRKLTLRVVGDYSPCAWFDLLTRKCRHYEHRPDVCREYEVSGDDCKRQRREAGVDGA